MGLTAIDILVLLGVGAAAITGAMRGFVTEVLSLMAWLLVVAAIRFLHTPVAAALAEPVGTVQGAAVLAFALLGGIAYFGGRIVANAIGSRTRSGFLGPVDRALGLGFGAIKGLILASLAFLVVALAVDTVSGGPAQRPEWMTAGRTYPLLNATSASIAEFVDRRRRGEPVFGNETDADALANGSEQVTSEP
ncbi:MAG: CvpA family protein [Sphingomonas sp.]|uniref:CvpA family protein n=1 Tax=Sphingomonas sp. TaxID=28214 RepID=UPI00261B3C39|nr:CvpA family protein [Sphingomonas sp.]MDK2766413.1 CvpA family protein [Sphingomonas sp.]